MYSITGLQRIPSVRTHDVAVAQQLLDDALATGHEGLGITTSLATAELIADMLTGQPSAIPREPYLPARFAKDAPLAVADPSVFYSPGPAGYTDWPKL